MKEDFQGMRGEVGEVVARKLLERHGEVLGGFLHGGCIVISFELMLAREHAEADGDEARNGLKENEEDDQADIEGDLLDAEGGEEGAGKGRVRRGD